LLEITQAFEHRRFRADETENNPLALRDKTQRREIAGAGCIVFKQKMIDVGLRKEAPDTCLRPD
jgi:hypothetical protein